MHDNTLIKARPNMPHVSVLGLHTYDVVRFDGKEHRISYLTRPQYWAYTNEYTVRTWPVFHLNGVRLGTTNWHPDVYIDHIRRDPDGRWFTDENDELEFISRPQVIGAELELWDVPLGPRWVFSDDVDYDAPVFHCRRADRDFNGVAGPQRHPPLCRFCRDATICWPERVTVLPPRERTVPQPRNYRMSLPVDPLTVRDVPACESEQQDALRGWLSLAQRPRRLSS